MTTATNPAGRPRRTPWSWRRRLLAIIPAAVVVGFAVVLVTRWIRTLPDVTSFIATYSGFTSLPTGSTAGLPAWVGWQHFLSAFLLVLIVRSGWLVRTTKRPAAFWTRTNTGLLRTKRAPKRISIDLWFHLTLDVLWILNGVIFIVLIFATGHWARIVPTSWAIFPNAVSTAIQYASLDWPIEAGWNNYNSLQVLAYFVTVFIAAPLAILTGVRMSPIWPAEAPRLNRVYKIELARAVHFPVMLYFVLFTVVHVFLVLTTGALRNLNHIYAANDGASAIGLVLFIVGLVIMAAAVVAARPVILRPIAALMGKVGR